MARGGVRGGPLEASGGQYQKRVAGIRFLEASWGRLGGPLGVVLGPLGAVLAILAASKIALEGLPGSPWKLLEANTTPKWRGSVFWRPLGAVLAPLGGRLGASWGRLGHLDRPRQAKTGQDKVS